MVQEMSITTHSAHETARLGQLLGEILQSGDVVLLSGDLGAGKTTFSKGVARGLGVEDEVTSPTFTLVAEHEGRIPLAHMDLYRLEGNLTESADDAFWEDYLESEYAVLIEWPQGLEHHIQDALCIRIERLPLPRVDERVFHCKATGNRSWARLDEWVKRWLF
jgi:tRNA threonylcarbamoyladenosine biosynthesis protein TsaE